jgi:Tat protein secretion system quality control protein TatD with DNase activity
MLPLVLHIASDGNSLEKCIEILKAEGWTSDSVSAVCGESLENRRAVLHDAVTACGGDLKHMELAVSAGFYCAISGVGITDTDDLLRTNARACIPVIPIDKLLVCSDSPWRTPQNLPDTYLRTLRNEPSNLPSIVVAISETLDHDIGTLGALLRANSLSALGMDEGEELSAGMYF